jgi:hypothetical protein
MHFILIPASDTQHVYRKVVLKISSEIMWRQHRDRVGADFVRQIMNAGRMATLRMMTSSLTPTSWNGQYITRCLQGRMCASHRTCNESPYAPPYNPKNILFHSPREHLIMESWISLPAAPIPKGPFKPQRFHHFNLFLRERPLRTPAFRFW